MNITFIGHSGFLVESYACTLLFDYYKGQIPEIDPGKPLFVFASHFHQDHFNPDIFPLFEEHPDVTYVLSKDVKKHRRIPKDKTVVILKPDEKWSTEDGKLQLVVETLKSNDTGVAFLVTFPEQGRTRTIYHAGDLNNWYWDEEPDSIELVKAYRTELMKIRGRHFDAAFIPLDPRLEGHAQDGILDFLQYAEADRIYPMHMWEEYGVIGRFLALPEAEDLAGKIAGEEFYVNREPETI